MAERSRQKVWGGRRGRGAESLRLCHWQRRHGAKASAEGKEGGSRGVWGALGPFQMDHNMGKLFRTVLICLQPLFSFFTHWQDFQSLVTDFVSAGVFWEG